MAEKFTVGDRVVLVSEYRYQGHVSDPASFAADGGLPEPGEQGTVRDVYGLEVVLVRWDRHSHYPDGVGGWSVDASCLRHATPLPDLNDLDAVDDWLDRPL